MGQAMAYKVQAFNALQATKFRHKMRDKRVSLYSAAELLA